jgi:hypothetical protein
MAPGWGAGVETVTAVGESDMIIQEFIETGASYKLIIYKILIAARGRVVIMPPPGVTQSP